MIVLLNKLDVMLRRSDSWAGRAGTQTAMKKVTVGRALERTGIVHSRTTMHAD